MVLITYISRPKRSYVPFLILGFVFLVGCHAPFSPYVDVGAGYVRFNTDDIVAVQTTDAGTDVETKIDHVDAFSVKARFGTPIVESIPQLRAGVELRGGIGAGYDDEDVDGEEIEGRLLLLMIGAGPYISWKQFFGSHFFMEVGAFASGYTVGVHESEREDVNGNEQDFEDEGGVGWGGGVFGKIGINPKVDMPLNFSLEFSYEVGEWEFGGDIDDVDVEGLNFLISSEIKF